MLPQDLAGKKIVCTAGRPREDIDGVRHYANHARPEGHGYAVAAKLAARGANVTIVAPESSLITPPKCRRVSHRADKSEIMSGDDLMNAVSELIVQTPCDAVLCLACLASIKPAEHAKNKLKMKAVMGESVSLPIVGNIDIEKCALAWGVPVLGYNSWQEKFSSPKNPGWLSALVSDCLDQKDSTYEPLALSEEKVFPGAPQNLNGKRVLITGGPTEELATVVGDVITNFSSGKQGNELASAFANVGAKVVYVLGPTSVSPPLHNNIQTIRVSSAKSMLEACATNLPVDVFVGVAAVADFGCAQPFQIRLTENQRYELVLDQNPDILETIGRHPQERPDVVVGFAAETDPGMIVEYAKEKLVKKNADLICANIVGAGQAHGKDENQIIFVERGTGARSLAVMSKTEAAQEIVRKVAAHFPTTGARKTI